VIDFQLDVKKYLPRQVFLSTFFKAFFRASTAFEAHSLQPHVLQPVVFFRILHRNRAVTEWPFTRYHLPASFPDYCTKRSGI
jgi:hypothetical protein